MGVLSRYEQPCVVMGSKIKQSRLVSDMLGSTIRQHNIQSLRGVGFSDIYIPLPPSLLLKNPMKSYLSIETKAHDQPEREIINLSFFNAKDCPLCQRHDHVKSLKSTSSWKIPLQMLPTDIQ